MITGHNTLQRHLHIMKIEEDPSCDECKNDDEETAEHFLTDCEAFCIPRFEHLGKMFLNQRDLRTLELRDILKFVRATKRFS